MEGVLEVWSEMAALASAPSQLPALQCFIPSIRNYLSPEPSSLAPCFEPYVHMQWLIAVGRITWHELPWNPKRSTGPDVFSLPLMPRLTLSPCSHTVVPPWVWRISSRAPSQSLEPEDVQLLCIKSAYNLCMHILLCALNDLYFTYDTSYNGGSYADGDRNFYTDLIHMKPL